MLEFSDIRLSMPKVNIGILTGKERELLRNLAKRVAELANNPQQDMKRELWRKHNSLQRVRPMVLAFPEDGWRELIPLESMTIQDTFWKSYEWYLKYLLYRIEHIKDDNIIDPVIEVPMLYSFSGWGLDINLVDSGEYMGSCRIESVLKNTEDDVKLKPQTIIIDEHSTLEYARVIEEVMGDILTVRVNRSVDRFDKCINKNLLVEIMLMRGIEQVYLDMYDRPEWLHKILGFMQGSVMRMMDYIEDNYRMDLNNGNNHVGTGGLGFTDELPSKTYNPMGVKFNDLWGQTDSQEMGVASASMFDEFGIQYQIPLMKRYGLSCYGCCESLNDKFDVVKKIPNLRRVSISPWTDIQIAADALSDKYIYSWKPHPVYLSTDAYDVDVIEKYIKNTLEVTRGCVTEIVFKDTQTFQHHPERLDKAVDIAMKLASEGYR